MDILRIFSARRLVTWGISLMLLVGMFITTVLVLPPHTALHAQSLRGGSQKSTLVQMSLQDGAPTRLEKFDLSSGQITHRWSDDQGVTWSSSENLGSAGNCLFFSPPTAVSSAPGHLEVYAMASAPPFTVDPITGVITSNTNAIFVNVFDQGQWSGWSQWAGGSISANAHTYRFTASPVVTSWGTGHMDMFAYGVDQSNGDMTLLHTTANQGVWIGSWGTLGTGFMANSPLSVPAAVSWGTGRVDVFVRGGGNELEHKWFANGQWSAGWENLGGVITSAPTVTSWGAGHLDVFARGVGKDVVHTGFDSGMWWDWESLGLGLDGAATAASAASLGVASVGSGHLDVFARGADTQLYHKWYSNGWSGWVVLENTASDPVALAWNPMVNTPPPPTPAPTSTPVTKPPTCGRPGLPRCPVTP